MLRLGSRKVLGVGVIASLGLHRTQVREQGLDATGQPRQPTRRYNNNNNQNYQNNNNNGGGGRGRGGGGGGRYYNNNNRNNQYHSHNQAAQQSMAATAEEMAKVDLNALPDDMKLLEGLLTKRFGPLSQLQTRFDRRGQRFKAQATFRQCGFAVELATGVGPTAVEAAKTVVKQSLQNDIIFIDPRLRVATASNLVAHTKSTFDELRTLCTNAGRMIKFSVVPMHAEAEGACDGAEADGGDSSTPVSSDDTSTGTKKPSSTTKWAVRSFVRDDWEAISQLLPLVEVVHESANQALNDNAFQILETYRTEFASEEHVKEDYLELCRHLKAFENKTLSEMCTEDQTTRTYTVSIQVADENGNAYQVQSKGNRQLHQAYCNASRSVFKIEVDEGPRHRPLINQLRWQVDAMCLTLYGGTAQYREEKATNAIHGQLIVDHSVINNSGGNGDGSHSNNSSGYESNTFSIYNGRVLAEETGQGSYRLEFKCYVTALRNLLSEHPEVAAANPSLPFFREIELDEAVKKHDTYDITNAHRGKWNPFAVLGTLTSSLIGSYYHSEFEDVPEGLHISTRSHLFINDGEQAARPLISRLHKEKPDSWRIACSDAIRDNFPEQHAALLKIDEYAQSVSRTEGMGSRHKGLARDQRAPHFSTLFSMLQSFTQEDFLWTQMQLISVQNTKTGQWSGEVHVLEAGNSKCVYQSDYFASAKLARKVACYAVSAKHYPKETQIYIGLNRGDYMASDRDFLEQIVSRTYDSRKPLTKQLTDLMEKANPHLKPITWKLNAMDSSGRQRATVYAKGEKPIVDVAGDPLETAVSTLQRALLAACKSVNAPTAKLMEEYLATAPANVSSERDLASYLFVSFIGKLPEVSSVFVKPHWIQTMTIELDDGSRVLLHRSEHESKKEGVLQAYVVGAKHSFPELLKNIASTQCDMREIAQKMLQRSGHQITLDGAVATENEVLQARNASPQRLQSVVNADGTSSSASTGGNTTATAATSSSSSSATPNKPKPSRAMVFLDKCMLRYDYENQLTTKLEVQANGTLKATITRMTKGGGGGGKRVLSEVAGTGTAATPAEAMHHAAVAVLENLFDTHLADQLEKDPELCEYEGGAAGGGDAAASTPSE